MAEVLNGAGLGTLLFDLLTPAEEDDRANVFDVPLLAERLAQATGWVREHLPGLRVGYFGASTGAAAALWAAAGRGDGRENGMDGRGEGGEGGMDGRRGGEGGADGREASPPSCPGAGGRTSRDPGWPRSPPPPCSSWAAGTSRCSN
nr:hypothetical protein GCM10020093_108530 [Planobispora longispora]